jgi:hypothetical protein
VNRATDSHKATETVTVRLPKGMSSKLRAATGIPFSTLVRQMCEQLLKKHIEPSMASKEDNGGE